MRRAVLFLLCLAPGLGAEDAEGPAPDAFAAALADLGLTAADLGYRLEDRLQRLPTPRTVAHALPWFEDLLAHPLDTYGFARTLGNAVEDRLTPEALVREPSHDDRAETLFLLGVRLGTERRIGGMRGYSANLEGRAPPDAPLVSALATLLERSGAPLDRPRSFGVPLDPREVTPLAALAQRLGEVPERLHAPLAALVLDLLDARRWVDLGLRHVTPEIRRGVFETLAKLTEDTPDGTRYHPALDDAAARLDEHSLAYGALKAMQAVQDARRRLAAPYAEAAPFSFALETPWGDVLLGKGAPVAVAPEAPFLCVTDRGTERPLGATSVRHPLSVALVFSAGAERETFAGRVASGVLGAGVLYAAGAGAHDYGGNDDAWTQGAGLLGTGVLLEEGGDDRYEAPLAAQGAGFLGVGLLLDAAGDDQHDLGRGDGQGYGGPGGVGVLADRVGNDRYRSEPDPVKAGRADYHSNYEVAVSHAQGAGVGRRGDGSDGHAWAGGLGALLDVDGDDVYAAGNFSQGLGYWFGTGILWDGGGNDRYESVYFTQGSGAHFAIGALIDEGGDDVHRLEGGTSGAALGFGWDVVNAFLIDRGLGNDVYEARRISFGMAEVRSHAFFLDEGGDDRYALADGHEGFGERDELPEYAAPRRTDEFHFRMGQVGLFLDLGGTDAYLRMPLGGHDPTRDASARDGTTWRLQARDPAARGGWNVALGRDVPRGRLGFLDDWPARGAAGP
jgi:hypothetical protein